MAYNVLAVDDSSVVRSIMAKAIRLGGVPVGVFHEAGSGSQALQILASSQVDLVLTGINMPEMRGDEMLAAIDAQGLNGACPIVLVTAEGRTDRVENLLAAGAEAYVRKPFTPERICQVVRDVLEDTQ